MYAFLIIASIFFSVFAYTFFYIYYIVKLKVTFHCVNSNDSLPVEKFEWYRQSPQSVRRGRKVYGTMERAGAEYYFHA